MNPGRVVSGWLTLSILGALLIPPRPGAPARAENLAGALGPVTAFIGRLGDPTVALVPNLAHRSPPPAGPGFTPASTTPDGSGGLFRAPTAPPAALVPPGFTPASTTPDGSGGLFRAPITK